MSDNHANRPIPDGQKYIEIVHSHEAEAALQTETFLSSSEDKAPKALAGLKAVIAALDGLGSCYWGCAGGDHEAEYLIGRAASTSRAAFLLLKSAYYDEALTLVRSLGELTNLLFLFGIESTAANEWKTCTDEERRRRFSPVKVRLAIEAAGAPVPVDENKYSGLSGRGVHVHPRTAPQRFNPAGVPTLGGIFQGAGALLVLNELSYVAALLLLLGTKQVSLPVAVRDGIAATAEELYDAVGSVDIESIEGLLARASRRNSGPGADTLTPVIDVVTERDGGK
jgi:hypothetical protein